MKSLKLSPLFGLLVLLLFAFSSCQQNDEIISEVEIPEMQQEEVVKEYFLPIGMDKASDEEIAAYRANLTTEDIDELVEHTRIADYLGSIGQIKRVASTLAEGDILTVAILENFLSEEQMTNFATYDGSTDLSGDRGCTAWSFHGCYWVYYDCCFPLCYEQYVCEDSRTCDWWDFWSARFRVTYRGSIRSC